MTHAETIDLTRIEQIGQIIMRPFALSDASELRRMANNWNIASMLSRMPYPYPQGAAEEWIESHRQKFASGAEFPLAITMNGELAGGCGVRRDESNTSGTVWELGYWVGQDHWGQGIATDAARTMISFAFNQLKADELSANHFTSNPASGRVLTKCGFRYTGENPVYCLAREEDVPARTMTLPRAAFEAANR